jgi:hypothetical protein
MLQRFLKQPTKDRLYAHKETISSLLLGLAAQGDYSFLFDFDFFACSLMGIL